MKKIENSPGAKRLIKSLIELGYDFVTAVADLIDNSIEARAGNLIIDIEPLQTKKEQTLFYIFDDGNGMNKKSLVEAMRFGSDQNYDSNSLGKYGLGLKTASLSQCSHLIVITKEKVSGRKRSKTLVADWDLDHIERVNKWEQGLGTLSEIKDKRIKNIASELFEEHGHGTLVVWKNFKSKHPLLEKPSKAEEESLKLLDNLDSHLGWTFHKFLQNKVPGRRKVQISVGGNEVKARDPFCVNEKKTTFLDPVTQVLEVEGEKYNVIVTPYFLPKREDFSSQEAIDNCVGPKGNMDDAQGFYFYRNGRLLKYGGWNRYRAMDPKFKLARVSVDFPKELDDLMGLNISKMKARFPSSLRTDMKAISAKWVSSAKKKYMKEGGKRTVSKGSSAPVKNKSQQTVNLKTLTRQGFETDPENYYDKFKEVEVCGVKIIENKNKDREIVYKINRGRLVEVHVPSKNELSLLIKHRESISAYHSNFNVLLMSILHGLEKKSIKLSQVSISKILRGLKKLS